MLFVFVAGVLGARLGLRACAQASKRKLHKISQRSETMVNGVSHAAIIVSTGLLDPAGAYAFGAYASKRNFKHETIFLRRGRTPCRGPASLATVCIYDLFVGARRGLFF